MPTINVNDMSLDVILAEAKKYIKSDENLELIKRAYFYAEEKHEGQYRKSGEPYLVHLMHVAYILARLEVSPTTIAAGLLHDVIEDCDVTEQELAQEFGEDITKIVSSVTKIGNLEFKDEKEYLAANHRNIFIAMANDIRVIFVKLVDRLHNMRTLQFQSPEKQKKIAQETLDVYAPIAHRLGIAQIKNELEDLSFQYLHPDKYYEIARLVEMRKVERDAQVTRMITGISELLVRNNIKFNIFGRSKHLYSIYKKMNTKQKRFDEILDLLAIRIITESELNCYEILGYIHAEYRPIPGRLKDYIAVPKSNMYQSLHTTLMGDEGNVFEIQIRTYKMDEVAEQGVAAHWRYKEGSVFVPSARKKEIEDRLSWFKDFNMMTEDAEDDALEYMALLQEDIFGANIYVMTPKGRVIELPNGATPLDFAYRVHTEVGHQTVGSVVNGTLVPLNTELQTGDVVSIKTNKQSGPSEDWLKVVKTSHARNKIRQFILKKQSEERDVLIQKGHVMFRDEARRRNLDEKELLSSKKLDSILPNFSLHNQDDLMFALATRALSIQSVFEKLSVKKVPTNENEKYEKLISSTSARSFEGDVGVRVKGIDSMMLSLSKCCSPVYGEDIVGYVTKGQGIKVHRTNCPNVAHEKARLLDVYWEPGFSGSEYETVLSILSLDRHFLLTDLVTTASQLKVRLTSVNSTVEEDKIHALTTLHVVVKDAMHLRNLVANLRKVDSVVRVERKIL